MLKCASFKWRMGGLLHGDCMPGDALTSSRVAIACCLCTSSGCLCACAGGELRKLQDEYTALTRKHWEIEGACEVLQAEIDSLRARLQQQQQQTEVVANGAPEASNGAAS
jgi:hypothetical protein